MGLYERIKEVAKVKGYSINRLEKELGYPRSSISKYNKNVPSMEKIQKIADFLNVPITDITEEEKTERYYINDETAQVAQEIFENKELRALFDVQKDKFLNRIRLCLACQFSGLSGFDPCLSRFLFDEGLHLVERLNIL